MDVRFEENKLKITLENAGKAIADLGVVKLPAGYLYFLSWQTGTDLIVLSKPPAEYSKGRGGAGLFNFLYSNYCSILGAKLDTKDFREKYWKPFIDELKESEEYQRFVEEAITPNVEEFRNIIEYVRVYKRILREEEVPVDIVVNYEGRIDTLRVNVGGFKNPDKIQDAFLKIYGKIPEELLHISKKEWEALHFICFYICYFIFSSIWKGMIFHMIKDMYRIRMVLINYHAVVDFTEFG